MPIEAVRLKKEREPVEKFIEQLSEKAQNPLIRSLLRFVSVFLMLVGIVSLINSIGFEKEIERFRIALFAILLLLSCTITLLWNTSKRLGWRKYYSGILKLADLLYDRPELGGIRPHLVIGVNQGGMIVGGLLYYLCRRQFHLTKLWLYKESKVFPIENQAKELAQVLTNLSQITDAKLRILLVDDSYKTGTMMGLAIDLVKEAVLQSNMADKEPVIKTAVLVFRENLRIENKAPKPDYYVDTKSSHFPYAKV